MGDKPKAPPETLEGKVVRSFYFNREPVPVGKVCELPRVFALEMAAANKFEIKRAPQAPAVAPQVSPGSPERKPEKVNQPEKKGAANAG